MIDNGKIEVTDNNMDNQVTKYPPPYQKNEEQMSFQTIEQIYQNQNIVIWLKILEFSYFLYLLWQLVIFTV